MVTPRTPTTRRRRPSALTPQETGTDHTPTELEFPPEGVPVDVIEHQEGKTLAYSATVKKKTNETQNENQNNESDFERESERDFEFSDPTYPEIKKTKLNQMFDDIDSIVKEGGYDQFFAQLIRLPDMVGDKFNIPCRDQSEIGVRQFTSRDRFDFVSAIQETNGDSGGRFNVWIWDSEQNPAMSVYYIDSHNIPRTSQIQLFLLVPNPPPRKDVATSIGNNGFNNQHDPMFMLIQEMRHERQEFKEMFLQTLQRPAEKSIIEVAREQMVINQIINAEQEKPFNPNKLMETVMMNGTMINAFGEMFQKMLMREPTAAPEPDTWDRVMQVANHPVAGQVVNKILEIGDAFAGAKLDQMGTANEQPMQPNPHDPYNYQDQPPPSEMAPSVQPMQELINDIIVELESDNPLDNTNETIQSLQADFPKEYGMIKMMCKGLDTFDEAFGTLLEATVNIQPYPFTDFLNFEAMQAAGKGVYLVNERGEKMKKRLEEFYNYVRTT